MRCEENIDKIYIFFLIIIIFFNEREFYLFKLSNTQDYNITIILVLVLFLISIKKIGLTKTFDLKYMIIIMWIMVFMTMVISNLAFNQSITYIIEANRYMLNYILYFSVKSYVQNYKNYNLTIKVLLMAGSCFALLATIQYFTYPNIIILKGISFAYRFNKIRFFYGFTVVIPSFFILVSYIFKKSSISKKLLTFSVLLLQFFYLANITKTRNVMIAVVITAFVIFLIQKKYRYIYKIIFLVFAVALMLVLFKDIINDLWEITVSDTTGTGESRVNTVDFILKTIKLSPILGLGMYSPKFSLIPSQIHVDVGILGFAFEFGIMGLIWAIVMFIMIIKKMIYIYKKSPEDSYFFIGYFVYSIAILVFNCLFNFRELIVYFSIIYALLETKYTSIKER